MNDPRNEFPPGQQRRDALLDMRRHPTPEDFTPDEARENERLADEFVQSLDRETVAGSLQGADD